MLIGKQALEFLLRLDHVGLVFAFFGAKSGEDFLVFPGLNVVVFLSGAIDVSMWHAHTHDQKIWSTHTSSMPWMNLSMV